MAAAITALSRRPRRDATHPASRRRPQTSGRKGPPGPSEFLGCSATNGRRSAAKNDRQAGAKASRDHSQRPDKDGRARPPGPPGNLAKVAASDRGSGAATDRQAGPKTPQRARPASGYRRPQPPVNTRIQRPGATRQRPGTRGYQRPSDAAAGPHTPRWNGRSTAPTVRPGPDITAHNRVHRWPRSLPDRAPNHRKCRPVTSVTATKPPGNRRENPRKNAPIFRRAKPLNHAAGRRRQTPDRRPKATSRRPDRTAEHHTDQRLRSPLRNGAGRHAGRTEPSRQRPPAPLKAQEISHQKVEHQPPNSHVRRDFPPPGDVQK